MNAPDKIVLPAAAGEMQFLLDDIVYIRNALSRMEGLMNETQQQLSCIIDYLEKEKEPDNHYTKRNELFDHCVANCDPKVMQEVSDKVDKLRAISTPAEEDWFKVAEEWEKEDKK